MCVVLFQAILTVCSRASRSRAALTAASRWSTPTGMPFGNGKSRTRKTSGMRHLPPRHIDSDRRNLPRPSVFFEHRPLPEEVILLRPDRALEEAGQLAHHSALATTLRQEHEPGQIN